MIEPFRRYSFVDQLCLNLDFAIRALFDNPKTTGAVYPAKTVTEAELTSDEKKHAAGLMRINHAGEICAQALYHGQSVITRSEILKTKLQHAAFQEGDHLAWCKQRLDELGSRTSYLNPFWYGGSFCIGFTAGIVGDQWSLGFLVETERQVIAHLENHIGKLPEGDLKSKAVLKQMEKEEAMHRDEAIEAGANELPSFIKQAMSFTSKIMVKTAYWI